MNSNRSYQAEAVSEATENHNIFGGPGYGSFAAQSVLVFFLTCVVASAQLFAQNKKVQAKPVPPLTLGKGEQFIYHKDSLGNRILDFSYCGYAASASPVPSDIPVKVNVPLRSGDATRSIQSAIDYVGKQPLLASGFRGVVLLDKGVYHVKGTLHISMSGVVLRGSGPDQNGTTILGEGVQRNPLIVISGIKDSINGPSVPVQDEYVPVNARFLKMSHSAQFKKGTQVVIHRPSTDAWIEKLGTRSFGGDVSALGWKPGAEDIYWSRTVTEVTPEGIELDAPITTALDKRYGSATVSAFLWPGRISHVGVENLRLISSYDHSREKDEDHRWMAVVVNNAIDGWVRRINFQHFAGSAVSLLEGAQRFTVEDCQATDPVSEIGGQRRYVFSTTGQQNLFQRLYSEQGYHDFSVGFMAAGPNAFVQCQGEDALSYSGSVNSWASGVLFDVVRLDGQTLEFRNLGQDEQGAGWNAANSLLWNCYASRVNVARPPTAQNYAFGTWAQFGGDGYWAESNNWMSPRSFYYTQLKQRLNRDVSDQAKLMPTQKEGSSSPTVEAAAALTKEAYSPALTMKGWIDLLEKQDPLPAAKGNAPDIYAIGLEPQKQVPAVIAMALKNGWLVRGGKVLTGGRQQTPWWFGTVQRDFVAKAKPAITRYVPGRTGTGLTDNLDTLTYEMQHNHITVMEQNYGLWYDRRRDDHERVRRQDGNVWPPFYELPFARSGKGIAWDGLSKYDLTRYNPYYWGRLKRFADLADQKGLVLIHHNYFQHNIIEAGAHYADFPWRPVNNINHTGFPEPVNYAADKRLFMAEQFYDETNPARRALHQAFIDQCLNNFKENHNVIQFICEEFTGPAHFVRFWLQTIRDWEQKNNRTGSNAPFIGLSTTKDVQDSILMDPVLSPLIKIIDIRYWYYQKDGSAYAPRGGQSLAPRQQARLFKPKNTSFGQIYRAVREYKERYPDKAVMYSANNAAETPWASFMAGGSLAGVPPDLPEQFLQQAAGMRIVDIAGQSAKTGVYALRDDKGDYIIYVSQGQSAGLLPEDNSRRYRVKVISAKTGKVLEALSATKAVKAGSVKLKPVDGDCIYWLQTR